MTNYLIVIIGIFLILLISAGTGCASPFGQESVQPTYLTSSYGSDGGMSPTWEKSRFPGQDPGIMDGNPGMNSDPQDGIFNPTGGAGGIDTGTTPGFAGDPAPVYQGSSGYSDGGISTWVTPSIAPVTGEDQGVMGIPPQQDNPAGTWTEPVQQPVTGNPEIISGDEQGVWRIPPQQDTTSQTDIQPVSEPVSTNPEIISGDEQGVWRIPAQPDTTPQTGIQPANEPAPGNPEIISGDEQGVWRIPPQQDTTPQTGIQPVSEPLSENPEIISGDEQGVWRIPAQPDTTPQAGIQPATEPVSENPEIISGDEEGVWRIPPQQENPSQPWTQSVPEPVSENPEIISGDEEGVWRIPPQQENPAQPWTQPVQQPVAGNPGCQIMPIQDPGIWRIPEQPPVTGVPCTPVVTPDPGGIFNPPGGYPSPGCDPGSGGGSSHQYPPGFHDGGDDPPREAYFPWEKYPADRWWRSSDSSYFRYHNAAILVTSSPSGANVYLRGSYKGKTPSHGYLEISDLAPGSYTIRVEHSGYAEYSESVIVSRNEVLVVDADLTKDRTTTPVKTGFLSLKSEPAGAEIYLDNRYMGVTPLTLQNIGPGIHGVILRKAGYMDYETDVSIVAGQLALISAILPENIPPAETPVAAEPTRAPVSLPILAAGLIIAVFLVRQVRNR